VKGGWLALAASAPARLRMVMVSNLASLPGRCASKYGHLTGDSSSLEAATLCEGCGGWTGRALIRLAVVVLMTASGLNAVRSL
jgi:hypothetical protein